jgi:acetyl esterase
MAHEIETASGMRLHVEDIEYNRPDGRPLLARLYRPQGPGPFPAIVDIHGGAWNRGDRLNNGKRLEWICSHGVAALSLDFRMPPEAAYPTSVQDINFGIRWFKARCPGYGVDPTRVGGFGASSGGHQIYLSAMRPRDPRYTALSAPGLENVDASLHYVIGCWPVIDPVARYKMALENKRERLINSHHNFWGTEEAMAEGSPQKILERGEKVEMPPGLIITGTADRNVDWRMVDKFGETYRAAGGSIEIFKYDDQEHGFIKEGLKTMPEKDAMFRIITFIYAQHRREKEKAA